MITLEIILWTYLFGFVVSVMFLPAYPFTWSDSRVFSSIIFWPIVWIPKAIKYLYIGLKEALCDL